MEVMSGASVSTLLVAESLRSKHAIATIAIVLVLLLIVWVS